MPTVLYTQQLAASESVDEWLLNGGQLERKRGRPRLVPEHIKLTHI